MPFATSSKARAACWSCRRPDGARASSTSSRPSCCAKPATGPALLISPLLALMRNQIAAAERMGVRAATINSDNMDDWTAVEAKLAKGEIDILLISPERLANERFRTQVLAGIAAQISMLVIDEAHCISDWGHDFRPHYRLLERIVKTLPPNLRLLATTATANNRVMEDLAAVLGPKLDVSRGDLNRTSLSLQTIRLPSQAERLAWLAEQLATLQGHGIIYTLTVRDANQVADWLKTQGFNVEAYTGETGDRREAAGTGAAQQPGQGAGCDDGSGHGLRQARSGVRHPLPDAGFGRRLLPAGWSCGTCAGLRLRRAAQRPGRVGHHGLVYPKRLPDPAGSRRCPGRA